MSKKPILCPIVEVKIPQDPNYDGHVRRQTPEAPALHPLDAVRSHYPDRHEN